MNTLRAILLQDMARLTLTYFSGKKFALGIYRSRRLSKVSKEARLEETLIQLFLSFVRPQQAT